MRWSKERIWTWYNGRPWIRGCNYMSYDCANRIDQWQKLGSEKRFEIVEPVTNAPATAVPATAELAATAEPAKATEPSKQADNKGVPAYVWVIIGVVAVAAIAGVIIGVNAKKRKK